MTTDSAGLAEIARLLDRFGLHIPDLRFLDRDAISKAAPATIHTTDRTPVIFDPEHGTPSGPREICTEAATMDIGGKATTGGDGRFLWKLSAYVCEKPFILSDEPVAFVATPRAAAPVLVTTTTLATGNDLQVEVFSWTAAGAPAPFTRFSWRCWLQLPPVIL